MLIAFLLTALAGLSTGIGSALAFFTRRTSRSFLSLALGFSAGVMIYISFAELLVEGTRALSEAHGESWGRWAGPAAFFGGFAVALIIDLLVPSHENPHEARTIEKMDNGNPDEAARLKRLGVFTALAIGIHNFPEGLATFAAAMSDVKLGISIAIAVAIHNIPEGISVAVPIYFATGRRDYNPIHFNDRFVKIKGLDGRICHGLLVAGMLTEIGGQIGWLASGMDLRFIRPVYFGDTVTCRFEVTRIDGDNRAVASIVMTNQHGLSVLESELTGLVPGKTEQRILRDMLDPSPDGSTRG